MSFCVKITTLAVNTLLTTVLLSSLSANAAKNFQDVPSDNTFATYIYNLQKAGVIAGFEDGTFRPKDKVTRGQMAKFVIKGLNISTENMCKIADFPDVDTTNTFYKEIKTLRCEGIVNGYDDGSFKPDKAVSRGEAVKFIVKALTETKKVQLEAETSNETCTVDGCAVGAMYINFEDVKSDTPFAEEIMKAAYAKIISGYVENRSSTFRPNNSITRGEMSKIIDNSRTKLETTMTNYFITVDKVNFFYDQKAKTLSYKGTVTGNNGCAYLKNHSLNRINTLVAVNPPVETIHLTYEVAYRDGICTQALVELPIEGKIDIELTTAELQTYPKLFKIVTMQNMGG